MHFLNLVGLKESRRFRSREKETHLYLASLRNVRLDLLARPIGPAGYLSLPLEVTRQAEPKQTAQQNAGQRDKKDL